MQMEYETIIIEGKSADRPWEGCINSVNYRVSRGIPVSVPRKVAEHIKNTESERKAAERSAEQLSKYAARL